MVLTSLQEFLDGVALIRFLETLGEETHQLLCGL